MSTIPPWSYSALNTFDNCPCQYFHRYILKEKDPETEVTKHGILIHKSMEDRIKDKKSLPEEYKSYERLAKSVEKAALGGEVFVELPLALDKSFKPCGFFDKTVWGRGKVDVVIKKNNKIWVGDWKTGKIKDKIFQLKTFAGFLFKLFPEIEEVHANNLWLAHNKVGESFRFVKSIDEPEIWRDILYHIGRIENAFNKNSFIPKQSGLCGYCHVKNCPNNTNNGAR